MPHRFMIFLARLSYEQIDMTAVKNAWTKFYLYDPADNSPLCDIRALNDFPHSMTSSKFNL